MPASFRSLRVASAVAALILATCLVVVAMLAVTFNLQQLRDSFGWVKHTDDVLLQVAGIESNLIAAESAERGFLLTGNAQCKANPEGDRSALKGQFEALVSFATLASMARGGSFGWKVEVRG